MAESKNYCMGCMKPIAPGANVCAHCYYDGAVTQKAPFLEKGTVISDRYLVGKIISTANDSVTYIGLDKITETVINIHEFLPTRIISRNSGTAVSIKKDYDVMYANCLGSFLTLWNSLKDISDVNCLPEVIDIAECNNTAYAICRNVDCISLKEYFEKSKKPLSWPKTYSAFRPLLKAFGELHSRNIVHGGISPTTVNVGSDGKLHLTGFSIPQCHSPVAELSTPPTPGFSALELYEDEMIAKPESDIYSLMSVMYYACTGTVPPEATVRAENDDMMVPADLVISDRNLEGLFSGLCVYPEDRCTLIDHLLTELAPEKQQRPAQNSSAPKTKSNHNNSTSKKKDSNAKKADEKSYLMSLAIRTFAAVAVICTILFCTLYTTVLYKNCTIPVLDNAFSWASFLPVTKYREAQQVIAQSQNEETTSEDTSTTSTEKSYVTVIDFTVLTYDEIKDSEIYNRNFTIKYVFEASDTVEKNTIMSQSLNVGESVLQGADIELVVSSGVEKIEVPLVIGMDFANARYQLVKAGLKVKKEVVENPGGNTEGEVCDATIVAGIQVDKGTEIVLSVWDVDPDAPTVEESDETAETTSDNDEQSAETESAGDSAGATTESTEDTEQADEAEAQED